MKYYVVAGTRAEYNEFIKRKTIELYDSGIVDISLSHFVYADISNLKGISNPRGFFIGTWKERHDIVNIVLQLRMVTHIINPALEMLWEEVKP